MRTFFDFILGVLPEAEAQAIEERLFADGQFAQKFTETYEQIIRDFLNQKLSRRDDELFRKRLAELPGLQQKVAEQEALSRWADQQPWAMPLLQAYRRPIVLMAASVLLCLGLLWGMKNIERSEVVERTIQPSTVRPIPFPSAILPTAPAVKERATELSPVVRHGASSSQTVRPKRNPSVDVATLFLGMPALRQEETVPKSDIKRGQSLRLQIELPQIHQISLVVTGNGFYQKWEKLRVRQYRGIYFAQILLSPKLRDGIYKVHFEQDEREFQIQHVP